MKKPVIFSGVQPSGNLTIGNYIGALKNWVELQNKYDCLFSLVDLHTITVRQNPKELYKRCYDVLAIYLAIGLDPKKNTIFLQSHVPAHTQLAWVLNCYAYVGELSRMTQFKDKAKKHESNINVGLFSYPVLMAADILLYQANLVPVGDDQKQHLELTRDLALRFNNIYGNIFTVPEIYKPKIGANIMSLQNPEKKMSKSDSEPNSYILMLDSPDIITNKLKKAVTDSDKDIYYDVINKPGVSNLLIIMAAVTGKTIEHLTVELKNLGYGKLKEAVAEALIETLKPIQKKYKEIRSDQIYLDNILQSGCERAAIIAQPTLKRVYETVGLVPLL
jgi:tryptophanyl-tRNA synthetase